MKKQMGKTRELNGQTIKAKFFLLTPMLAFLFLAVSCDSASNDENEDENVTEDTTATTDVTVDADSTDLVMVEDTTVDVVIDSTETTE